jgi:C4-dicarboxylate transporter, DctM subunit
VATLLIVLLGVLFVSGAPLFTIMLGGTALGALYGARGFEADFDGAIVKLFGVGTGEQVNVLSTIPLFIYAGYLLAEARTADRLVRFANAMLGWMPGGLAIVTIGTCSLFTVFTGASGVTIIALGGVLMPALVRSGYPERFSIGLIAGTGSVGLLFPPALPLFIYGTVYGLINLDPENWDTKRFLFAGVVPGLVLIGMLSAVAVAVAVWKKLPRQQFSLGELGRSFLAALPELFIPFGVILGLASGFGLPEIASLTVFYVVILEVLVFRSVGARTLWAVSHEAMAMIGAIFIIIFASTALTDFMVNAEVPGKLVTWTQDHVDSRVVFLLAINVILLIVGTVMDIFSAIVVVLPLIAPIAKAYGIDPYHLGVIFLLNLEVGYLHPPVGLNLFLTSVKFRRPITEVMWATIPFLITMIAALMVITYVPALTIVPEAERLAPVANLVAIVEEGIEEIRVSIPELALTDAAGKPLAGPGGKPITRKFVSCRTAPFPAAPGGPPPTADAINKCQKLFFDVTECVPDAKAADAKQTECKHRAIAAWTADEWNADPARAVIVVTEVALVDQAGAPLTVERDVLDKDGKPVLEDDSPKKEQRPIVDAAGKPVTRALAWCDALEFPSDTRNCRSLFVAASACKINFDPAPPGDCLDEKCPAPAAPAPVEAPAGSGSAGAGSAAGSAAAPPADQAACRAAAAPACMKARTEACIADAVKSWVDDNGTLAYAPKLKANAARPAAAQSGSSGGCAITGGAPGLGALGAGALLLAMRRRRAHRRAA